MFVGFVMMKSDVWIF